MGLIIIGSILAVGIAVLVVFKIRWSRQAKRKWATTTAGQNNLKR
jgi:hypothetical protein